MTFPKFLKINFITLVSVINNKNINDEIFALRCKSTHPCEQRCTDNGVAVICSCNPGYDLANDGRSCIPKSPKDNNKKPDTDEDNELSPLCPSGYRYNATNQVCDGTYMQFRKV